MSSTDLQRSYDAQSRHERSDMLAVPSLIAAVDSVDAWRHRRMLDTIVSLVKAFPNSSWLTVGDGRYGSDAAYLRTHGARVVASSITDATLSDAKKSGFIDEYRVENAEELSLSDESMTFVLCKESYHHFPRPPVALYEMLRVASQAVILIEPMEEGPRLLDWLKGLAKRAIGRETVIFESSGNFLYRLNPRELGKLLCSINHPGFAIRKMNDSYLPQVANAKATGSWGAWVTRRFVNIQDSLCSLGLLSWGIGVYVIFKVEPSVELLKALNNSGFAIVRLPKNPYINGSTR